MRAAGSRNAATLGRLGQLDGGLDTVINGLLKITGRPAVGSPPAPPTVTLREFCLLFFGSQQLKLIF
jgi:hypothetical protein